MYLSTNQHARDQSVAEKCAISRGGSNVYENFKKEDNSPSIINNFHFKHWNMHHCTYKLKYYK